jgi:hypothetical protein
LFDISSLRTIDKIEIAAYLKLISSESSVNSVKKDLDTKLNNLISKKAEQYLIDRQIAENQKVIDKLLNSPFQTKVDNFIFQKDLSNYVKSNLDFIIVYYQNYQRGILPFSGCLSEQPAQSIELVEYISKIINEIREEQQEKQSKKDKQNVRK